MYIDIIKKSEQAKGEFNFGAILENKPVGFPGEGGRGRPFSSLFYWAHAWAPQGDSTIGLHPHKGFEIMSFVLRGEIEHYDTGLRQWRHLHAGDAQVIRAGNGISHSEKLHAGSAIFQIWLDPNLHVTLGKPASYDDYASADFPLEAEGGKVVKRYVGEDAPMQLDTPGTRIEEWRLGEGEHAIALGHNQVVAAYLVSGEVAVGEKSATADDFLIGRGQGELLIEAKAESKLFLIWMPQETGYPTYAAQR